MDTVRKKRGINSVFSQPMNSRVKKLRRMSETVKDLQCTELDNEAVIENKRLDLAFVLDCTLSMDPYIEQAKESIRLIVDEIMTSENCDVRLALIEFRDHPPEDRTFVTRSHGFTDSVATMRKWLGACRALGGGDIPEAVEDGIHDLLSLDWKEDATKFAVCVVDAPPHGLHGARDHFSDGCPLGIDPVVAAHELARRDVTLYTVGCEPAVVPFKDFYMSISAITGGQYVPLVEAEVLPDVIVGAAREEISLRTLSAEVHAEIRLQIASGRTLNKDSLSRELHRRWTSRTTQVRQLQCSNCELETLDSSTEAVKLSQLKTLADIRAVFVPRKQLTFAGFGSKWSSNYSGMTPNSTTGAVFGSASVDVSLGQASRLVNKTMSSYE